MKTFIQKLLFILALVLTTLPIGQAEIVPKVDDLALSNVGPPYAIIHYYRDDGDYGDHTSADYNDYWGLHLWGNGIDPIETTEWTAPKPFLGEDEYGRFAWVKLVPGATQVGFIVHRGDTKDGTASDRFFDPSITPEIWLKQDYGTKHASQADAQGFVTIEYHRPDGDYGDPNSADFTDFWGLHLWGNAIDISEITSWTEPKRPSGFDDFGAFFDILIQDVSQPVSFTVHRGDTTDPIVSSDRSFIPVDTTTIWSQSEDSVVYEQRGAAEDFAIIHYHRDDGDYGDPNSGDFNDFWGLHVWSGAANPNPSWTEPMKPVGEDVFGIAFKVDLVPDAPWLAYIIHRGDEKDPGPDQFLDLVVDGYEVWQLENANEENPYILPVSNTGSEPPLVEDLIAELVEKIALLDIRPGIINALISKLEYALKVLEDENTTNDISAINVLHAFINNVEAQRGKVISDADADDLIAAAQALIDSISE